MDFLSLGDFGINDAIDILIVSFILYRILLLIQGTRAVPMAVGLVLLFVFYNAARFLQLRSIDWLLTNVFAYFVFAVIVLFASEIRKFLATIGRTPLLYGVSRPVSEGPLDHVVTAVTTMAAELRGAIIVFERGVGLRNYVQAGIVLNADISYDLLVSIFHPESPMHDGAVIIQGDRIAAASCFLPLTRNPRLARELGSRHRAAIGLSEETDAVVVVVSEESGSISVAVDRRLTRRMDAAGLRGKLEKLLLPEAENGKPVATPAADKTLTGGEAAEGLSK